MSNKFTGITSAGSAIPVYDKDAHSALSAKLDTTAFSSVSGEFATVDDVVAAVSGKADTSAIPSLDGYATTEDVISATSGLQPSGDYATNSAVAAALSGKADTTALVSTELGQFTVPVNSAGSPITVIVPTDVAPYVPSSSWSSLLTTAQGGTTGSGTYEGAAGLNFPDGSQLKFNFSEPLTGVAMLYLNYAPNSSTTGGPNAIRGGYLAGSGSSNTIGTTQVPSYGNQGGGDYGKYLALFGAGPATDIGEQLANKLQSIQLLAQDPSLGVEVDLNRYYVSADTSWFNTAYDADTKRIMLKPGYSLTANLSKINPTYKVVSSNSATWNNKADKSQLDELKSEFVDGDGVYVLHVPSATDIIGTQLSSVDILTSAKMDESFTNNDFTWGDVTVCSAYCDVNTNSAEFIVDLATSIGANFYLYDSQGAFVFSARKEAGITGPQHYTVQNLTAGTYITRLNASYQNLSASTVSLTVSGYEENTTTYSGILAGGGGATYSAGEGIDITGDVISVTGKVDTSAQKSVVAGNYITITENADNIEIAASGVQPELTFGYNSDSAISAINGSALAGGGVATYSAGDNIDITDDVISGKDWTEEITSATSGLQPSGDYYSATNPSGFMTELPASATEAIDTVTANSGTWGGSALPISAGPGIKVNLVDNTLVFSNDETVLYNDLTGRPTAVSGSITLSESPLNFEYVEIYLNGSTPSGTNNISNGYEKVSYEQLSTSNSLQFLKSFAGAIGYTYSGNIYNMGCGYSGTSGTTWTKWYGFAQRVAASSWVPEFGNSTHLNIWKIVGINRVSGGN